MKACDRGQLALLRPRCSPFAVGHAAAAGIVRLFPAKARRKSVQKPRARSAAPLPGHVGGAFLHMQAPCEAPGACGVQIAGAVTVREVPARAGAAARSGPNRRPGRPGVWGGATQGPGPTARVRQARPPDTARPLPLRAARYGPLLPPALLNYPEHRLPKGLLREPLHVILGRW